MEQSSEYHVCCYNYFQNGQSQEFGFSFMFGKDVYIFTLVNLLQPKPRYITYKSSMLSAEMLREAYMSAAINIKRAGDKPVKGQRKYHSIKLETWYCWKITRNKNGMQNTCKMLELTKS